MVTLVVFAACKGVDGAESVLVEAQVVAMHAAFGSVHASASGSAAVVEEFCRQAGEHGALCCLEDEAGHGGGILSKVHHESLARCKGHLLSVGVLAEDGHLAVDVIRGSFDVFPYIRPDGCQREVFAEIDLSSFGREYVALELGVFLGRGEQFGCFVAGSDACIVLLSVEDSGVGDGPCDACAPVLEVCAVELASAVDEGQFHHSTEGAFVADHAVVTPGRDDFVCPPSGCHLYCELVLSVLAGTHEFRDVVGVGALGLLAVGESGFQHFLTYALSVDVEVVDAQSCRHPAGLHDAGFVLQGG